MNLSALIRALSVPVIAASAIASAYPAGSHAQKQQVPWTGAAPKKQTVAQIMAREHGEVPPPRLNNLEHDEFLDLDRRQPNPSSLPVSQWPPADTAIRQLIGGGDKGHGGPYTLGSNFLGGQFGESGYAPPDSQGAVGPTQFLVCINGRIKVFSKAGVLGALNTTTDNFFAPVLGSFGTSDPRVRYDRLSQRWFVVMIDVAGSNNRVLIAVSDGPTITSGTVWSFYYFLQNAVAPAGDTNLFADYPSLGVDANALYIGCNMYGGSLLQMTAWVVRKSSLLSGGPIVATAFRNLRNTTTFAGPWSPQGVDNDDPASTFGYIIGVDANSWGRLTLRRVTDPGGTPVISSDIYITVPNTYFTYVTIGGNPYFLTPQVGTTAKTDSLDDRLFSAQIRTNRLTGVQTLWTSHNIQVNASGVSGSTAGVDRTAARWYEIGNLATTPALVQSGTVFDSSALSVAKQYSIPSVNMNGQGHMSLGATLSGQADHPSVTTTGRLFGDPLGTTQAPTPVITSTTVYALQGGTAQRWGDYSKTTVDPNDDMTVWSIQEYCNATNSWAVRVFQLLAPPPATITNLSPNNAAQGTTLNVTVSGTSVNGSGFFDPGAGFPNHLQASFSGSGITVNSVTFNGPTQATLNITVSAGAAIGARDITITNPDGQSTTLAAAFTVTSSTVTVNPTSFTTFRGNFQSGTLAQLLLSDDSYVSWKPGAVLSSAESPVDVIVDTTSPVASPSSLQFVLEARSTETNVRQLLQLYNYVTASWEQVDLRQATTSDSVVTVTISSNASRFINPSGLAMRARVAYKATGPVLSYPWTIRLDQAIWRITP